LLCKGVSLHVLTFMRSSSGEFIRILCYFLNCVS
jgi:hypothetical protein